MRARAFAVSLLLVLIAAAPASAQTQDGDQEPEPASGSEQTTNSGGAEYGAEPVLTPRLTVPGAKAVLMEGGIAAAPADAPPQVQAAVWAANDIQDKPYRYGGGHARFKDTGYDCSGTISFALNAGGFLKRPLDSSSFMSWGARGKGRWITVFTNPGHAYVVIAGLRLDTSSAGDRTSRGRGPRWRTTNRPMRGFRVRHPVGF